MTYEKCSLKYSDLTETEKFGIQTSGRLREVVADESSQNSDLTETKKFGITDKWPLERGGR